MNVHCCCYAAKLLQLCPTLCGPIDGSLPGSPVPGILQARSLEWAAISFSNAWKWKVEVKSLSRVRPSATPWTAAFQVPPSMGFSRQEHWSGCHCLICSLFSHFMLCSLLVPSSNGSENSPMFDMSTTVAELLSDYCIQVMILHVERRLNISPGFLQQQ